MYTQIVFFLLRERGQKTGTVTYTPKSLPRFWRGILSHGIGEKISTSYCIFFRPEWAREVSELVGLNTILDVLVKSDLDSLLVPCYGVRAQKRTEGQKFHQLSGVIRAN